MRVILQAIILVLHGNSKRMLTVMGSQVETTVRKQDKSTITDADSQVTWSEIVL